MAGSSWRLAGTRLILAALFLAPVPLAAQIVVETPAEAVARVSSAIAEARAKDAALPPPTSDSDRLLRMLALEQAPRLVLSVLDLRKLGEADKGAMWAGIWALITPIDEDNQARLLDMVPPEGWFPISRYGTEAAKAAFLIVQHGNQALWRRFLPRIEAMAKAGEAEGGAYALMYDRLALSEGRPQLYGSQMSCTDGRWALSEPVEDRDGIDARRKAMGLESLVDNLRRFENRC